MRERKMDTPNEIRNIIIGIERRFILITELINISKLEFSDDYRKINHTYYRIFCCNFESFFILVKNQHFSSSFVLLRTMLELWLKSHYFEFVEKEKATSVSDLISNKKDFPKFFKMAQEIEACKTEPYGAFDGIFRQFTKKELATYETLSLFSHGRGDFLKASYENNKLSYTKNQIKEALLTAKGLFETLSWLLFYVQDKKEVLLLLIESSDINKK